MISTKKMSVSVCLMFVLIVTSYCIHIEAQSDDKRDTKSANISYYIWLGGSTNKPFWTVSRCALSNENSKFIIDNSLALLAPLKQSIGVYEILLDEETQNTCSLNPKISPALTVKQTNSKELIDALFGQLNKKSQSKKFTFELMPNIYDYYKGSSEIKYICLPCFLAIKSSNSSHLKNRLIILSNQLSKIAEEYSGKKNSTGFLKHGCSIKEISTYWEKSILRHYNINPCSIDVDPNGFFVKVVLPPEIDLRGWGEILSGG